MNTITMGLCSLWLPLVVLLPLVRIAPVYTANTQTTIYGLMYLVAIKNSESGLEVHTHELPRKS